MKYINKGREPLSLKNYRDTTPDASYSGYASKADVREVLIKEQGAICAYCMKRISLEREESLAKPKIEIEHYLSQDTHPDLQLDYSNMLGVCNGNQKSNKQKTTLRHLLHCDKSKDSKKNKAYLPLTINPLKKTILSQVKFLKNGEIFALDSTIQQDIDKVLNLNEQNLKKNRAEVILFVLQRLKKKHPKKYKGDWKVSIIQDELKRWSSKYYDSRMQLYVYKEYAQVAIYYLEGILKKLKKGK